MNLTKELCRELIFEGSLPTDEYGDNAYVVLEDNIVENTRWSILHEVIVHCKPENSFWRGHYSVGATEYQDEQPWEYDDPQWVQVWPHEVTTTVYKTEPPHCFGD